MDSRNLLPQYWSRKAKLKVPVDLVSGANLILVTDAPPAVSSHGGRDRDLSGFLL
jgi:hypothetical protein